MSESRLADLLNLCNVPRWAVVPVSRPQTVAEHSYRVAAITMTLAEEVGLMPVDKNEALVWALVHDGSEAESGDIPARFKRRLGYLLQQDIKRVAIESTPWLVAFKPRVSWNEALVKLADLIEAELYLAIYGVPPRSKVIVNRLDRDIEKLVQTFESGPAAYRTIREAVQHVFNVGMGANYYWEDADGKKFNDRAQEGAVGAEGGSGGGDVPQDPRG